MKIDQNVQKYWKKLQEINDIRINNINIYKQANSNLVLTAKRWKVNWSVHPFFLNAIKGKLRKKNDVKSKK